MSSERKPFGIFYRGLAEESGFVASYPELPGCITCGDTVAEVVANAEDAKKEGVSMNQYCVYLLAKNSEIEHISIAKKQAVLV